MPTENQGGSGHKLDQGKIPMDLLPPYALQAIATVFGFGAKKYAPYDWHQGIQWSRLYAALQRHLTAWWQCQANDPESGKSHLWHAGCCLMMLIEYEQLMQSYDDRPALYKQVMDEGSQGTGSAAT